MKKPIRLSELGRGRHWAEYVERTGEQIPIVDADGREVAWLIPATEALSEALLNELERTGLWSAENLEGPRNRIGDPRWRYHRARNAFLIGP